jgi:hypothetical protein
MKSIVNRGGSGNFLLVFDNVVFGEVVSLSRQVFAPRERWGAACSQFARGLFCRGLEVKSWRPSRLVSLD